MKELLINYLDKTGKTKIEFNPGIKINIQPLPGICWLDKVYITKVGHMATLSTLKDAVNVKLERIPEETLDKVELLITRALGKY